MTIYPLFTVGSKFFHSLPPIALFLMATVSSVAFSPSACSDSDADTEIDLALTPYNLSYAATYNGMDIEASRQDRKSVV